MMLLMVVESGTSIDTFSRTHGRHRFVYDFIWDLGFCFLMGTFFCLLLVSWILMGAK